MKINNIMLSMLCLFIGSSKASQNIDTGGLIVSSPSTLHKHSALKEEPKKMFTQLKTKDPYDLEEISVDYFNKRQFEESAHTLILSAIYGEENNLALLSDIDHQSLKYIRSSTPFSDEALSYYQTILMPRVTTHISAQFDMLDQRKDSAVNLYEPNG